MPLRRLVLAAVLTALVLAARRSPAPTLVDASTGAAFSGGRLALSPLYIALTPFSSFADALDCASARQKLAFGLFLLALFGPFRFFILGHGRADWARPERALPALGLYLCLLGILLAAAAVARPAAKLELDDPDLLAVDFHAPEAALLWHERSGFDGAFVPGEEPMRESRRRWEAGERGLPIFMTNGDDLPEDAREGLLTPELGDAALASLAASRRRADRFLAADAGGRRLSAACWAWNVLRIHAWRLLSPLELRAEILSELRRDGYSAVRVAERARVPPAASDWSLLLDPARSWWLCARGWSTAQAVAALCWIWALPLASAFGL